MQTMLGSRLGLRRLHTLPRLHIDAHKGVPGLFSAAGFKMAWTEYQQFVLNKLNAAIVDTENATRVPFHIMMATRTKPETAHVFNYASQVHSNHLFFYTLRDAETEPRKPTGVLEQRINETFGGLDGLKRAVDRAAAEVLGSGWVFLVETPSKKLAVVPAHVAGSPATYSRQQTLDLNGEVSEDAQAELSRLEEAVGSRSQNWNVELFALNLWQHAYVPDFGIAGRQKYIDAWWNALDWAKVDEHLFKGRV